MKPLGLKILHIALGILPDGTKEIPGIWIEQTEGARFWMRVMNEIRNRGVADIVIAVVDGLREFPEAINAVSPQTVVRTCVIHLICDLKWQPLQSSWPSRPDPPMLGQRRHPPQSAESPIRHCAALRYCG